MNYETWAQVGTVLLGVGTAVGTATAIISKHFSRLNNEVKEIRKIIDNIPKEYAQKADCAERHAGVKEGDKAFKFFADAVREFSKDIKELKALAKPPRRVAKA